MKYSLFVRLSQSTANGSYYRNCLSFEKCAVFGNKSFKITALKILHDKIRGIVFFKKLIYRDNITVFTKLRYRFCFAVKLFLAFFEQFFLGMRTPDAGIARTSIRQITGIILFYRNTCLFLIVECKICNTKSALAKHFAYYIFSLQYTPDRKRYDIALLISIIITASRARKYMCLFKAIFTK